jgi:hypothetical protein
MLMISIEKTENSIERFRTSDCYVLNNKGIKIYLIKI